MLSGLWTCLTFFPHRVMRSTSCFAASTPAGCLPPRPPISRIRATTSGGCCTRPGSRRGFTHPSEQFALLALGYGVTNAAYRTTPGSGDLRRADFAGSAERLERLAHELEPGWFGFVGKEAYRGVFNERPELGVQSGCSGDEAVRPSLDVSRERGGSLVGAAAVVPRAAGQERGRTGGLTPLLEPGVVVVRGRSDPRSDLQRNGVRPSV